MRLAATLLILAFPVALFAIGKAEGQAPQPGPPEGALRLPPDYRQWQVVSVAHEAGDLNDIRVILANPVALRAYRAGRRPFPDGSMLARVAWKLVPSARNDAVFGRAQSFVPGAPTNVQLEVKDARAFAATGGWGYGQFKGGRPDPAAQTPATCFACHDKLPAADDRIFTAYAEAP